MNRRAPSTPPLGPVDAHPTSVHYDNEIDFFHRFLDPYMKYTSGLYTEANATFDQAACAMLDKQIALAHLPEGARVLDIGCGWGSLYKRLRERHPHVHYSGLTPSAHQIRFIRENYAGSPTLIAGAFEDLTLEPVYDAIFLSGVYCHLREKAAQLARIASLLKPGGTIVLEDTFFLTEALFEKHGQHPKTRFVQQDIFGYAEIPSLGEHLESVGGAGLKVVEAVENSADYARTIAEWMRRLAKLDASEFPLAPDYLRYMGYAQQGWNYTTVNYVMSMRRTVSRVRGQS